MIRKLKRQNNPLTAEDTLDLKRTISNLIRQSYKHPKKFLKAGKIILKKGPRYFLSELQKKNLVVHVRGGTTPIILQYLRLAISAISDPFKLVKAGKVLFLRGPREFFLLITAKRRSFFKSVDKNQQYKIWLAKNYPTTKDLFQQKTNVQKFKVSPKISILVPTYNTTEKFLRECIESVIDQSYENWELCLADDASSVEYVKDIIQEYASKDKRIKYIFREKNGHISEASNSALKIATGDFVALLDHDDFLWPNALFEVVKMLQAFPKAEFFYSDEDKLSIRSTHEDPFFKPDWSPDYLRSLNYITHFAILKKSLVEKIGGFRVGFEGAQDWDLFLRSTREIEKNGNSRAKIIHIPTILYSWRKSRSSTASGRSWVKSYAYKNQKKVLEDDLSARNFSGEVISTGLTGIWRVKYSLIDKPLISIVIPTKEKYSFIYKCINSILNKTTYPNYELIIVDSGSTDQRILDFYESVKKRHNETKILTWENKFNFSSVCNFGVEKSKGEYIVLLNNDTEVIVSDWLEAMLEHAQRKEVGAVGCKLLYPNFKIQHAGVILGIRGGVIEKGVAGHAFKMSENTDQGEHFQAIHSVRNYIAVTAACLMISKEKYNIVGGLDPIFRIAFNDVDFCLKVHKQNLFNVYTPYSVLYHHESVTVGTPEQGNRDMEEFRKEIEWMHEKWGNLLQKDPFYNSNLTLDHEDFSLKI